jgi:hypothetical protein
MTKNKIIFPVLINNGTDKDYRLQGVPMLFLIDGLGNIQFEHRGYRPDIGQNLTIELNSLLERP